MANALGTGTHERKETYATEVLAIARAETNIYEDFSEDYEKDEVTGKINVPTRNGEVEVSDYDILNGIELKQSGTDYLELPVDKDYGVNELIDGYEAAAVPDNLIAQRIESAGYSIGLKKESMAIEALINGGTVSSDTNALTEANVYKKIATEIKNMKARNMKVSSMRVAVSADVELLLLTDEKFSNTAGTLGAELVREGVIGKINGVPVKPNYLMDEDVDFIIYDKRFCQKYEVWKAEPTVEDIKDGKHIKASALQGRQVGGLMVTNALGVQIKKGGISTSEENGTGSSNADNSAQILTNLQEIATNTSNIKTDTETIATNTNGLSTLQSQVNTNASDISALKTQVETNTSNIATNTSNISTNTSNISTNTSDIETNKTNIATNTTDISALKTQVEENTSDIADLKNQVSE